jgi:hypothetical protein
MEMLHTLSTISFTCRVETKVHIKLIVALLKYFYNYSCKCTFFLSCNLKRLEDDLIGQIYL